MGDLLSKIVVVKLEGVGEEGLLGEAGLQLLELVVEDFGVGGSEGWVSNHMIVRKIISEISILFREELQFMKAETHKRDHWDDMYHKKKKVIVYYGEDVLDLTGFVRKHPGGEKAITVYILKDIKNILFRVFPHSDSIIPVLMKYRVGKLQGYAAQSEKEKDKDKENENRKGICTAKRIK